MKPLLITKKEKEDLEKQVNNWLKMKQKIRLPHMVRKLFPLVFALLLPLSQTFSQEDKSYEIIDYTTPGDYYIKEIKVTGVKYLDKEILSNLSGLREGERIEIPGDAITKAIENLWSQKLFSDIKIFADEIKRDSVVLNLHLQELPRLSKFELIGIKNNHKKDIKEKLKLKAGNQLTDNVINDIKETIKDYYYDKKYLNTEIDIKKVDDTTAVNRVMLKVYIDTKEKVKIKDIVFHGNTVFSDGKLRREMEHTHKKNWNIFQGSKFIREKYEEDKDIIIEKYRKNGYRDAKIVDDTVYAVSDDRIKIEIDLKEGKQYFFRDINWTGNTKYPSEYLTNALKIEKGDPFNMTLLNERINIDQDAVGNLYLDNGYLFFNANPVVKEIDNDSIDIEVRIHEGKQARLNRVIVKGNTKTNEHVIRRELRTLPGDLFSKSAIQRSQRELAQLGFFDPEKFGIEPINIKQSRGEVDLEYSVVEKANDQLELSGGWGAGMLVGTIGVRFNNFSAKRIFDKEAWRPVPTGDGQSLSIRAQTNGRYYQNYSFTFVEPWLGGKKPNQFTISMYHSIQNNSSFIFQQTDESFKITGASVGLQRRLKWPDDYFLLSNSISYKRYTLENWFDGYFIISDGISNNLSFQTTFARNSVDQPIYPRRGSNFSLSLQLTPPYSLFKEDQFWELTSNESQTIRQRVEQSYGEDWQTLSASERQTEIQNALTEAVQEDQYRWIEYHKWMFKGKWFLSLVGDLVLATNTEFGYLGYYNKDWGYSPFGSFDVGGSGISGYNLYGRENIALRGYEDFSLTPVEYDENGNRQKVGHIYEKVNMEIRYPITLKQQARVFALAFIEAGNAWKSFEEFDPFYLKRSAGVGIRAFLPMFGLLGIDWGYGFDEIPGQEGASGSQFHFVVGQQF
jgi:outer membrane protein insertion porin family